MTIEFKAPEIGPNADALTSLTRGRGPRRGNLEDLLKYWRPIMKKPGGFRRCVVILMDKPQFGGKPQRICAWLHHELTGKWPNEGKGKRGRGKGKRKRRGRSVTRRVRSAGKKSLTGISPLTEVTSLRMTIRESREFGGILVQPIAGRKNAVEMKAAMFLQHSERLPLFAGNEVKRVGAFGSSSRLGQAAQAAGSIILPGDLSDIRSPIRSQIYETLTPGAPNIPNARGARILRSRGRGARNKFRCPPGFEKGGTFTNSEFSTCGAQILGIASIGPGSPTAEANNRLSRLANTAGLVNEIGDLRNNDSAVDIIRAAQIPAAPKKGSPTRAQTSIDLVLTRYEAEDFPTKVVRRDGVILEPVVSVEALGKLNEFDDMADGSLIERYEAGQIGASTVPAFSTNLRNVFVSIPDAGAVQISRVGGEISDAERAGLLRSFATGISRSADLPDPSAAVRAWADGSDGRFTVEFGEVTETGFEVAEGKNDLIKVATAGGKTETVPRWVYETFLSRSAPRRAKDAPIYEIVAEEGAEEKSGSPFAFSQKSAPVAADFTDVLDAKYYHMSINSKIEAFTSLTEIDFKAPRGRGLGRRIGRGGRAVGGRSRAVFDNNLNRYRCPPGTRYGGRFSNQFASNCGYSLPRQIVNNLVDMGIRLEDAMELRRRRRLDTSPGDGRSNLKPETAEKLDDAIRTLDAATGDLGRVFEKTEGVEGGRLGRTIGEARRDVDLTPEERELLEGDALEAALQNLRDVMNDQDLANANLDEIRKAYKAVEKAANTEAGRLSDNPPRTPEQRSRRDGILGFLRELILRLLGLWNEDDERARAGRGRDVVPGDEGVPGGPGGGGPRRPRAPGVPGDGSDSRTPDGRTPDGRTPDGRTPDGRTPGVPGDADRPEVTDEDLERILVEFRERAEAFEVAGGGMTVDFVESLDDNDLDKYISAFQLAAERLADDPQFDDINDALNRLLAERERRNRDRSLVNANLRDRFDIETADGLAEAIEHFEDLADQYDADGIMTVDFFERLNDDEIAFFRDVFDRAMNEIGDNEYEEFQEIFNRLEDERLRRDRLNKKPTMTDDEYKLILKEMNAHMERYQVVGGGKTADFLNAISDDDLIKYRRAIRDGLEADAFREGEDREKLQELLQRMDAEFDRRFRGPGKRPRIESEENPISEKYNLDGNADLIAAIEEWQRRAEDFEVTGGGMTQNLLETLSDEELAFFEDAHLRLRDVREADGDFELEALNEIIDRLAAERDRRRLQNGFDLEGRSDPDSRSLRNVNNRFPRNGLPGRAYWRDDDYNGSDAAELDRRFGDYYDADGNLNDRGRLVNQRLRRSDPTDPNRGGGSPDSPDPTDPDEGFATGLQNLSRFDDDELDALIELDEDLPFDIERISDEDLERLNAAAKRVNAGADREDGENLRNAQIIFDEYVALLNDERRPDRLGVNVPDAAGAGPDGPSSGNPNRLRRYNDSQLESFLVGDAALPFDVERISDEDLERLHALALTWRGQGDQYPNVRAVFNEYLNLERGRRLDNRLDNLGPGDPTDQPRPQRLPQFRNDPGFNTQGRRDPVNMPELDNLTPEQVDNLAGAAVREHQEVLQLILDEVGPLQDGWNVADLEAAVLRRIEEDSNAARGRILSLRLQAFRELNQMVDGLAAAREEFYDPDTAARVARDLDVLKEYLPRLARHRRGAIMGLRDNRDAALSRIGPDFEFLVDGAPSANRVVDEPEVDININRVDADYDNALADFNFMPDRFLNGLDLNSAGELLDRLDARGDVGQGVDPQLREAVKARYVDLLNSNDGDVDDLARRMGLMSDTMLDDMSPRDRAIRQARLRAGTGGRPPSREAAEQADRLRAADQRRAARDEIPEGPVDVPSQGTMQERVAAVLGGRVADYNRVMAMSYLRRLSDDEFDRLYRREQELREFFEVGDPEQFRAYKDFIGDRIQREFDRRARISNFQLDRNIEDRSDAALNNYARELEQRLRQRGLPEVERESIRNQIRKLDNEFRIRELRNSPSVVDMVNFDDDLNDQAVPDDISTAEVTFVEDYLNNPVAMAMLSSGGLLRMRDKIQNSPNLSNEERERLMQSWDRAFNLRRRLGNVNFERNRRIENRSIEALDRHIEYINKVLELGVANDEQREKLRDMQGLLRTQRNNVAAALGLELAVDTRANLNARWRKAAKWNFLKARRRRQQQRELKIKEIAQRRYARRRGTHPRNIGGWEGLSGLDDAGVRARIKDTFLVGQTIDVGTVEINGETYSKRIVPTVGPRDISISRHPNGKLRQIEIDGKLRFELVNSNGDVVKSETYDGGDYTRGRIHRLLKWDENGQGYVSHLHLGTKRQFAYDGTMVNFAGGGFTDEMFNNNLLFYRNMGIDTVTVSAAGDGNIVWPRIGFRAYNQDQIKGLNRNMADVLENYRAYKVAKETGRNITPEMYAAKAIIQDDRRADRVEAMLIPFKDPNGVVDEMPGMHDYMLALDGENTRNSVFFQLLRGQRSLDLKRDADAQIAGLDNDMLDELFADEPELEDKNIPNPFDGILFGGGQWDISDILTEAGGDPRNVTSDLISPYDRVSRQPVASNRRLLDPDGSPYDGAPVRAVPVGTNNINTNADAIQWVQNGGDMMGVPDEFLNISMLANSDLAEGGLGQFSDEYLARALSLLGNDDMSSVGIPDIELLSDFDLERLRKAAELAEAGVPRNPDFVGRPANRVPRLLRELPPTSNQATQAVLAEAARTARNPNRRPNPRFVLLNHDPGGINQRRGSGALEGVGLGVDGNALGNGAQIAVDTETGQSVLIKYSGGTSYGYDESANELVGRAVGIRLGFEQGQVRIDGPAAENDRHGARGLVFEALNNYIPEGPDGSGVSFSMGSDDPSAYLDSNGETLLTGETLDDVVSMVVLDFAILNTDRHSKNWLQYTDPETGKLRLVPIDMGLGMRGRESNGNPYNIDPDVNPVEVQARRWAADTDIGLFGRYRTVQKRLRLDLATNRPEVRQRAIESAQRALDALRAAQEEKKIEEVLQEIRRAHGGLTSAGWARAERLFLQRYGWLMNPNTTGENLLDELGFLP